MGKSILVIAIAIVLIVGQFKCFIKMVKCNWEPVGKAEIIYTLGTFTGMGAVCKKKKPGPGHMTVIETWFWLSVVGCAG